MKYRVALLALSLFLTIASARAVEVDILFSDRYRPHVEAVQALKQGLRADDVRFFASAKKGGSKGVLVQLERIKERKPDLLVVVGEDALQAAISLNIEIPTLSMMSMTLRNSLQDKMPLTGIDLRPDPSLVADELARQLARGEKVVSYYNPKLSGDYIEEAKIAFRKQGLVLVAQPWSEHDVQKAVNESMKDASCYWMQMEYQSVAPDTLRLLFGLAKKRKILVGLSEKYVRAGALLAWTPQVKRVGEQAAVMANRILEGEKPERIKLQHPGHMKLSVRTPDSRVAAVNGATVERIRYKVPHSGTGGVNE